MNFGVKTHLALNLSSRFPISSVKQGGTYPITGNDTTYKVCKLYHALSLQLPESLFKKSNSNLKKEIFVFICQCSLYR